MSKIVKTTLMLMTITIFTKILGFGRELVLASSYGATMYSDAYITAMNIPTVIFAIIGGSLSNTIIPIGTEVKINSGEKEFSKFINNTLNIVVIICLILSIIGILFAEEIVSIFAMGFHGETYYISVKFTKIMMLSMIFNGLSYIMTSFLQINNNFKIPSLMSIPKNIIIIISIILSIKYNPYIIIWGTVIGVSSEFVFQLFFAIKQGYKYKFYLNISDKYVKKMLFLIPPILIGVAVNQVNTLVDRTLASTLVEGSISALNYANRLNGFILGIFISSIAIVIYPMLSKLSVNKEREKFTETITNTINTVIILIIPISVGAIVLSYPIVKVLFERGLFDSKATQMTSIALKMYSIGLIAFSLRDIVNKIFYSIQDTKTPMINGAMTMCLNIILNLILVKRMGLAGLALATSVSAMICIIMLMKSLGKKIGYYGQDKIVKVICKTTFASIVMGIATNFVYYKLNIILNNGMINQIICILISVLVGVIIYSIFIILFRVDEIKYIINTISKRLNISKV